MGKGARWIGLATAALTLGLSGSASAVSIPNETAWAAGTNWEYRENFMGFPSAWVYTPDSFSPRTPGQRGLMFYLVGCGHMPFQAAQAAGWPDAAEANGLVVVIPTPVAPVNPNFNAPNLECLNYGTGGVSRNSGDQAAIIAAAEHMAGDAEWSIDPRQVYVSGMSAGGGVAVQVGCMAPDVFTGVATAAAPGLGTSQNTAIFPAIGHNKNSVIQQCQRYADGSPAADPRGALSEQMYAIVSDNNTLDPNSFNNQDVWDGDKLVPHIYNEVRAEAFSELLAGGGAPDESGVVIAEGEGIGCPGGEAAMGDGPVASCLIANFEVRPWQALADIWRDDAGRVRVVKIEQDTLRHAWPAGPLGPNDTQTSPNRDDLRAEGFLEEATGRFVIDRVNAAPNGKIGVIYVNHQAMDFSMYVANLFTENNPRLGDPMMGEGGAGGGLGGGMGGEGGMGGGGPMIGPPVAEIGTVSAAGDCVTVQGTASADGAISAVEVHLIGVGALDAQINGGSWEVERCGLLPGSYQVVAVAADDAGQWSEPAGPSAAEIAAGNVEIITGDLTEHADAGRVIRFTQEWLALREQYCETADFINWVCEPFDMYRCEGEGDDAWSVDRPDDCGGELPSVSVAATATPSTDTLTVGDTLSVQLEVTNDGPDDTNAAYVIGRLPAQLALVGGDGRCASVGDWALCHLEALPAGGSVGVEITLEAVAAGDVSLEMSAGSPQSAEVSLQSTLSIAPGSDPMGGAGGGEGGAGGGMAGGAGGGEGGAGGGAGGGQGGAGGGQGGAGGVAGAGGQAGGGGGEGGSDGPGDPVRRGASSGCEQRGGSAPFWALLGLLGLVRRRR